MKRFVKQNVGQFVVIRCKEDLVGEEAVSPLAEILRNSLDEILGGPGLVLDLGGRWQWDSTFLRVIGPLASHLRKSRKKVWAVGVPMESMTLLKKQGMDGAIVLGTDLRTLTGVAPQVPKLDVAFVNPFLHGAKEALKVLCQVDSSIGKPKLNHADEEPSFDIAAELEIKSPFFHGAIAICFPQKTFFSLMSKLLKQEVTAFSPEIESGASELLNVIFGSAKRELNEIGLAIEKAVPDVVRGSDRTLRARSERTAVLILPFLSDAGDFHIELSLS